MLGAKHRLMTQSEWPPHTPMHSSVSSDHTCPQQRWSLAVVHDHRAPYELVRRRTHGITHATKCSSAIGRIGGHGTALLGPDLASLIHSTAASYQ